ncbi:unnamed protein product [Hermetia illucens]|uniref:Uncharacterized protein n=1 Tax=Hermetia illucens TaxID=343691 RepID=A0A7R8UAY3_HERIL|nr:unnamed protein product [Hermetia illucens]
MEEVESRFQLLKTILYRPARDGKKTAKFPEKSCNTNLSLVLETHLLARTLTIDLRKERNETTPDIEFGTQFLQNYSSENI